MPSTNGPYGVVVSWNENHAAATGQTLPIMLVTPLLWGGVHNSTWLPLPLTSRLGVPLRFMKLESGLSDFLPTPRYANLTLAGLCMDVDTNSDTLGQMSTVAGYDVIFSRADGKDLDEKQMKTITEFVASELHQLHGYGLAALERGLLLDTESTQDMDEDEDDSEDDDEGAMENTTLGLFGSAAKAMYSITRAEAEAEAAKITPETFTAFFEKYRTEMARIDAAWEKVECPVQPPACQACNKVEQEAGSLLVCGACRLRKYCDKDCQKQDWAMHKAMCKAVGLKKAQRKK